MKNYNHKYRLIVNFFLCASINSFGMETSSQRFPSMSLEKYFLGCKNINEKYDKKLKSFIEQITDHNVLSKINKIESQLEEHRQDLLKQKENTFSSLKIRCNIDDSSWNVYVDIMDKLQKFRRLCANYVGENVVHDTTVPEWFLSELKKQLILTDFNPQQVHIHNSEKVYMEIVPINVSWTYDDGLFTPEYKGPGTINIHCENLHFNDPDLEKGRCMLLAHMLKYSQSINIIPIIKASGVMYDNKESDACINLQWTQSLLGLALKSQHNAFYLKRLCRHTYSSICSLENYKKLSAIDFCWRALERLKRYSSPNKDIPLIIISRQKDTLTEPLRTREMIGAKKIVEEKKDEASVEKAVQKSYDEQKCYVCHEYIEDMCDIAYDSELVKDFMCRKCYNKGCRKTW